MKGLANIGGGPAGTRVNRGNADGFELDRGGRRGGIAVCEPRASIGASRAQQTIRVGWTIPAEESKYWMMRFITGRKAVWMAPPLRKEIRL